LTLPGALNPSLQTFGAGLPNTKSCMEAMDASASRFHRSQWSRSCKDRRQLFD
jgi:hypothetical protein